MKKKIIRRIASLFLASGILAGAIGTYLFFKPHRDVQSAKTFAMMTVDELTTQFTKDYAAANARYLSSDGNSKVLVIIGPISKISVNLSGEKMFLIKNPSAKTGVSVTFTLAAKRNTERLKVGDTVKVKGVIAAGNKYDPILDLYEYAVMVQCDLVK